MRHIVLHTHPGMEREKRIDGEHVIIDKEVYDEIVKFVTSLQESLKGIIMRR